MQRQGSAVLVRVLVDMVQPVGIEGRGPSDDPVDLVALLQEKFREVGAVLSCNAGDERCLNG